MILSPDHLESVLAGGPLQRRIFDRPEMYGWVSGRLHSESLAYSSVCVSGKRPRILFERGCAYPLQTGYRSPVRGHARLISIHREDVREISDADLVAIGYQDRLCFLAAWAARYDKEAALQYVGLNRFNRDRWRIFHHHHGRTVDAGEGITLSELYRRPAERYAAWALTYEVSHEHIYA